MAPLALAKGTLSSNARRALLAIFAVAAVLRIAAALTPNIYWADETFQVLEQAHRLVFGYGVVPWEYVIGYRSWLGAGLVSGLLYPFKWLHLGPVIYAPVISIFFALSSVALVWSAFVAGLRLHSAQAGLAAAGLFAVWYELVYFGPKPIYEVVSTTLLFTGFALALSERAGRVRLTITGVLFGFAIAWRPTYGVAIAPLFLLVCHRRRALLSPLIWIGLGGLAALLFAGLLDLWTWGGPFYSYLRYSQMVDDYRGGRQSAGQGSIAVLMLKSFCGQNRLLYALPLLLIASCVSSREERTEKTIANPNFLYGAANARRISYGLLLLAALGTAALHVRLRAQEYRWLFAMIPLLLLLFAIAAADLLSRIGPRRARTALWVAASLSIIGLDISTANRFDDYSRLSTGRYTSRPFAGSEDSARTVWTQAGDDIRAYEFLSKQNDLCGLVDADGPWFMTPGYFHLHKPILIEYAGAASILPTDSAFTTSILPRWMGSKANYLVAPLVSSEALRLLIESRQVEQMAAFGEVAVYRKAGKAACSNTTLVQSVFVDIPRWVLEEKGKVRPMSLPLGH